jgi:hypothetical protein
MASIDVDKIILKLLEVRGSRPGKTGEYATTSSDSFYRPLAIAACLPACLSGQDLLDQTLHS